MRLENQVCTQSQAARLKELGVVQNGIYSWLWDNIHQQHMLSHHTVEALELIYKSNPEDRNWSIRIEKGICSAFSCAELGMLLPDLLETFRLQYELVVIKEAQDEWLARYVRNNDLLDTLIYVAAKTETECKAKLLIHLLENKLATIEEVNSKLK